MLDNLTVRQTLQFTAELRMPGDTSDEERRDHVQSMIDMLGLTKCADSVSAGPVINSRPCVLQNKRLQAAHNALALLCSSRGPLTNN